MRLLHLSRIRPANWIDVLRAYWHLSEARLHMMRTPTPDLLGMENRIVSNDASIAPLDIRIIRRRTKLIDLLFTVEYFESVRRKLNPGGLFTFWFHAYEQSDAAVRLMVRTVGEVFPHIMLFGDNDLGNLIAVASMEPIEPDFAKMERRYQDPGIRKNLARLGMRNLIALLSHHRVSQKQFGLLAGPGPLNTVGHQRLEYMAPRSLVRDA